MYRVLFLSPNRPGEESPRPLVYRGGWLLTTPEDDFEVQPIREGDYNNTETVIKEISSEDRSAGTEGAHLHRRGNLNQVCVAKLLEWESLGNGGGAMCTFYRGKCESEGYHMMRGTHACTNLGRESHASHEWGKRLK